MRVSTIQAGFSVVLTLSLVVGLLTSGGAQSFRWLGGLSHDWRDTSNAFDVSADGRVVVGQLRNSAVCWADGSVLVINSPIPRLHNGVAYGVSADGRTVVGTFFSIFNYVAFRWTPETSALRIPGLENIFLSVALDVSADGRAIVGWAQLGSHDYSAFRWTPQTGVWNLSVLLGSIFGAAQAITPDGSVFVGYDSVGGEGTRATLWTAQGQTLVLGTLPNTNESRATGVSPDGTVVVGFAVRGALGQQQTVLRPFRWTQQTGVQDLGSLPGFQSGQANGVAENGVVVGTAITSSGTRRAFVWTESEGIRNLTNLYTSVIPSGAYLTEANAISLDGRYIVGRGYNPRFGREEAYLLDTWPRGEVTGNGCINNADLLRVLFAFGTPGTGHAHHEDINKDGVVNNADLLAVLFNFGHGCN